MLTLRLPYSVLLYGSLCSLLLLGACDKPVPNSPAQDNSASTQASAPEAKAPFPNATYLRDAAQLQAIFQQLSTQLGETLTIHNIELTQEQILLDQQDPADPKNLRRFHYQAGQWRGPSRVDLVFLDGMASEKKRQALLAKSQIDLAQIQLNTLPELIQQTLEQAQTGELKVDHIRVEIGMSFEGKRVYKITTFNSDTPDSHATLKADFNGKPLGFKIKKPKTSSSTHPPSSSPLNET